MAVLARVDDGTGRVVDGEREESAAEPIGVGRQVGPGSSQDDLQRGVGVGGRARLIQACPREFPRHVVHAVRTPFGSFGAGYNRAGESATRKAPHAVVYPTFAGSWVTLVS